MNSPEMKFKTVWTLHKIITIIVLYFDTSLDFKYHQIFHVYGISWLLQTEGHNWHIHQNSTSSSMSCVESIGGHYNPFMVSLGMFSVSYAIKYSHCDLRHYHKLYVYLHHCSHNYENQHVFNLMHIKLTAFRGFLKYNDVIPNILVLSTYFHSGKYISKCLFIMKHHAGNIDSSESSSQFSNYSDDCSPEYSLR